MKKLKITVPEEVKNLSYNNKLKIAQEFMKSLGFKATLSQEKLDQSMWSESPDPAIAKLEDDYYDNLAVPLWFCMLELFDILGLELPVTEEIPLTEKSFDMDIEKGIGKEMERKYPGGRWVTMRGRRVYIDKDGAIVNEFKFKQQKEISKPEKGFALDKEMAHENYEKMRDVIGRDLFVVTPEKYDRLIKSDNAGDHYRAGLGLIVNGLEKFLLNQRFNTGRKYTEEQIREEERLTMDVLRKTDYEGMKSYLKDKYGEGVFDHIFDNGELIDVSAYNRCISTRLFLRWTVSGEMRADAKKDIENVLTDRLEKNKEFVEHIFDLDVQDNRVVFQEAIWDHMTKMRTHVDPKHVGDFTSEVSAIVSNSEYLNDDKWDLIEKTFDYYNKRVEGFMYEHEEQKFNLDFETFKTDFKGWHSRLLIQQWAKTSADHSAKSIFMQKMANEMFNLDANMDHFDKSTLDLVNDPITYSDSEREMYKEFLQAQYDSTQEHFRKNGVKEVIVYRGVGFENEKETPGELLDFIMNYEGEQSLSEVIAETKEHDEEEEDNFEEVWTGKDIPVGRVDVNLQPISSYAITPAEAVNFANMRGHDYSFVMATKVPVERIFSTCRTGFGCLEEAEVTVLGGKDLEHVIVFNNETITMENVDLLFDEEKNKSLVIDLIKSDDGEKLKDKLMGEVRKRFKERLKFKPDGRPYTARQLADIEKVMKKFKVTPDKWAESLSTRAFVIGKLLASRDAENKDMLTIMFDTIPKEIEKVRVPFVLTSKEEGEIKMLPLQSQEANAIEWAKLHAGEEINTKEQEVIAGVRRLVIQARMERWEPMRLSQELFDKFGQFNRDWRRIALTETSKAVSNGYLMGLKDGDQVIIQEAADMCVNCRRLNHGKVFTYRERPGNDKTEVWVGKTNYGKKTRDWSACVPLHPHCRGRYVKFNETFYKMGEEGKLVRKTKEEIMEGGLI